MAKLKWYEMYDYESNASKFLKKEEKNIKRLKKWKTETKTLRERAVPPTAETGMTGVRTPETPEWYRISQDVQSFDYERSVDQEYEISKRSFPGLKIPNFKEVSKAKTTKLTEKEDITGLLSMAGATQITPRKVYKYKTIDRKSNAEVITPQKEIEVVGENQYNYFYFSGGKLGTIPKDETSTIKLTQKELETKFKENINKTAKLISGREAQFASTPDTLTTEKESLKPLANEPFSYYLDRQLENLKNIPTQVKSKLKQYVYGITTGKQSAVGWETEDTKLTPAQAEKLSTVVGDVAEGLMAGTLAMDVEDRNIANTIGEVYTYVNPISASNALFKLGEKIAVKAGAKFIGRKGARLAIKTGKKIGSKRLARTGFKAAEEGIKGATAMGTLEVGQEAQSYLLGKKELTAKNLDQSAIDVLGSAELGFGFGAGTEALKAGAKVLKPIVKKGGEKLVKIARNKLAKSAEVKIQTKFSEATAGKYGLNKDVSKLTDSEKDAVAKDTMDKMLSEIGKRSIDKTKKATGGKAGPKKVFERALADAGVKDIKILAEPTLKGDSNYAKVIIEKDKGKITKVILKYNNAKPRATVAGAVEHEVRHLIDDIAGHKLPKGKIVKNPKTVYDLLKSPEHHKGMESFEVETLERIFKEDVETLQKAPNLGRRIEKKKYTIKSPRAEKAQQYFNKWDKTLKKKIGKNFSQLKTVEDIEAAQKAGIDPIELGKAYTETLPKAKGEAFKKFAKTRDVQKKEMFKKIQKMEEAQETLKRLKPEPTTQTAIGETVLTNSGEKVEAELSLAERVKQSFKTEKKTTAIPIDDAVNEIQWGKEKTPWELYKKFIDKKVAFKDTGKKIEKEVGKAAAKKLTRPTEIAAANYNKHHAVAVTIQTKNLVGRDGRLMNTKSLMKLIDAGTNQENFENYILLNHHLSRNARGLPIFVDSKGMGLTEAATKKMIDKLEKAFPTFKKAGDDYVNWMDDFSREWLGDNLLSEKLLGMIREMYPYYAPTNRILPGGKKVIMKNRISSKVLKEAKGGMQNIEPISYSLPGYIERVVRADRKNKVFLALTEQVLNAKGAMDDVAQIIRTSKKLPQEVKDQIKAMTKIDTGMDNLLKALENKLIPIEKTGNYMVALSKGEPIVVQIKDKSLWDALYQMERIDSGAEKELIKVIGKATQKFKNVVTTYNPIFWAYRNPIRDIPTAYIQGAIDNPIKFAYKQFVSGAKIASYLMNEFTGIGPGSKTFARYKALGSETSNYLRVEGKLTPNKWEKFWNAVATLGNGIESIPRFTEFEYVYRQAIKKGMKHERAIDEALYAAGEVTVDFSRHGEYTKVLDAFEPYLNAKTQGLNKLYRTFKEKPLKTILKGSLAVTLPSSMFYMWNKNIDPVGYDNLPDYVRDNYYTIPLGDSKFWKVPKTNAYALAFSNLFERTFRMLDGDPYAFENLTDNVWQNIIIPSDLATSGIMVPMQKILMDANKDYFGRDIVPQYMLTDQRSKRLQKDERTSWGAEVLGDALDWSPKQIDFLIKSYLGAIGSVYFVFSTRGEGSVKNYFDKLGQNLGLTTKSEYGRKEMREQEEKKKIKQNLTDFEIEKGIKDLRYKLKNQNITSTNEINERIKNSLGPNDFNLWQKLKDKNKQNRGN